MDRLPDDLEVFERRTAPRVKEPFITIQKSGTISVNQAATEVLGTPPAVELMFSRKARMIVFKPAEPGSPHAYPMRKQGRSSNYLIGGKAFCNYYDIPLDKTRRYAAEQRNGVLAVDLNQGGLETTRLRDTSRERS